MRNVNFKYIVTAFLRKSNVDDGVPAYAGQICYFMFMSAIPFVILLGSFLRYTVITDEMVLNVINEIMPVQISDSILHLINEFYNKPVAVISLSAVVAFWAAAKGIHCIVNSLNKINDFIETRNWFVVRFKSMFFVLVFIAITAVMMLLVIYAGGLSDIIKEYYGEGILLKIYNFLLNARFWILFIMMVVFFTIIYRFFPNRTGNGMFWYQLPGAIGAALSWYVFSVFFAIFVKFLNGYRMYGQLASIIALMFWFYVCICILLYCAEINVMFEQEFSMAYDMLRKRKLFDKIYKNSDKMAGWMDKLRFFDVKPKDGDDNMRANLTKTITEEDIHSLNIYASMDEESDIEISDEQPGTETNDMEEKYEGKVTPD